MKENIDYLIQELEELREYKKKYPPEYIEKLQHDIDVLQIDCKNLQKELDYAYRMASKNPWDIPE